jgi:phosphatidylserine/phosphatidylglycerophosphate/cardiolipin synthase-like enzyme
MTAFEDARAVRLPDRQYFDFALASVETARRRIWASLFLQDIRPSRDLNGQVLELTMALIARSRVGVDVRVLLSGDVNTPDIAVANLASGMFLAQTGVQHRRAFEDPRGGRGGSHAKFFICDAEAVAGSQNWTDDAFRLNIEDAVVVQGPPVELLAEEFLRLWETGRGLPRRAAN